MNRSMKKPSYNLDNVFHGLRLFFPQVVHKLILSSSDTEQEKQRSGAESRENVTTNHGPRLR